MSVLYDFRFYNSAGNRVGSLDAVIEAEIGRQKNDVGAAVLVLPGDIYAPEIFEKDALLEIWRFDDQTRNFTLVGDTLWFLRRVQFSHTQQGEFIELVFFDSIDILRRRVIPWYAVDPIKSGIDNYPSVFLQHLDDTLKMIFFHNFMEGAVNPLLNTHAPVTVNYIPLPASVIPSVRVLPVSLEPYVPGNLNEAPVAQIDFAWKNCLDAMQDVVALSESFNVSLWFDLVYTPGTEAQIGNLMFKTWTHFRGRDLRDVIFNVESGNLAEAILVQDYTEEATIVYGIGSEDPSTDDGIDEVLSVSVAFIQDKPFYPIETVMEAQTDVAKTNLDLLESQARAELITKSPVLTITGELVQTGASLFFYHYNFGDLITAGWKDIFIPAEITKFDITINEDGETITIPIETSKFLETTVTA